MTDSFFSLLRLLFKCKIVTFVMQRYVSFFLCFSAPVTSVMIVSAALGELILPLVVGQVSVLSNPLTPLPTLTQNTSGSQFFICFSVGL